MKTLNKLVTAVCLIALAVNSNAQAFFWSFDPHGFRLLPETTNVGIGTRPDWNAKLRLRNNGVWADIMPDTIFGLHSTTRNPHTELNIPVCGIYSDNSNVAANGLLYGAYFKNTQTSPTNRTGTLYGIRLDNKNTAHISTSYGVYVKNEAGGNLNNTYGYFVDNTDSGAGNLYGFYANNTSNSSSAQSNLYGIFLNNNRPSGSSGNVYGIYSTNTNNNSSSSQVYGAYLSATSSNTSNTVHGIYSVVSGGNANNRWAGYFIGGNVAVMNGNLGVGTATPQVRLDVVGDMNISGNISAGRTIEVNDLILGKGNKQFIFHSQMYQPNDPPILYIAPKLSGSTDYDWSKQIILKNDGSLLMNAGNLGVGTATPQAKLHVESGANTDASILATSSENNKLIVRSEASHPVNSATFRLQHEFGTTNRNNGYINFHRGESVAGGFLTFGTNGIERLRIDANGNVGIGTTDPQSKLQVAGDVFIPYTYSYWIGTNEDSGNRLRLHHNNSHAYIDYTPNLHIRPGTNTTTATFLANGNVGIGRTDPHYKLDVNGIIRAREVLVNINTGADFVFEEDYALRSLDEVYSFIRTNKHLPEIPSAAEMVNNGLDMGEFQIKLLQKVEELTLYIIAQDKRIKELEKSVK